ncbi:type III pantothenate kinase [Candidatus Phycosocius spiralis]|uniref:Type III pantothenate kinase n=1 Tax=Candidatus Phycosocius spiralis TaxID=2815099 RepID=A0ABQ4PSW9_9PROT|nr:type III pantothenate kinase [Candidatus Phycosocius spiralis]GIU66100.1 type III pantothenate kinase [Candidatus Phycosocius spiralis]
MLLAIDVGNTNSKFAVHDGKKWRGTWRAASNSSRTADEYAVWLDAAMRFVHLDITVLNHCVISTVVPQALFHLRNLSRRYVGVEPWVVGENAALGIEVRIPKPSEAGADRLVNAIGSFIQYGGPSIVIDSGTATTFDIVGADGAFEGGIISPGINLSLQALHTNAARLPRIEIRKPDKVIGTDTVGAMQSGVFWGYIELIDGLIGRIKAEYGEPMKVIATGGVASLFEGASNHIDFYDQDLTPVGLLEIFERNGGRSVKRNPT